AAGHVDCNDRKVGPIETLCETETNAFQGTRKAGPEHGVDNDVCVIDSIHFHWLCAAVPAPRHLCGVTLERLDSTQMRNTDVPVARFEMARNHVAVAAIVSWPAKNDHVAALPAPGDFIRDRATGVFHQFDGSYAVIGSKPVGGVHL